MASLVTDCCTLCNDDGTSTEAVRWCIECEVFLCTDCDKYHKKSRSSKAHNTMSTKDYHNLPKFMQEIIASDGQLLVVRSVEKSTIVNLNDMSQTILEEVVASRVALFKGNIYGTIYNENKVCCYKSSGEALWTFQHDDIVDPLGITLDRNGFVYVVSQNKDRVVVVSPDGKTCKTILSEADGIKYPHAIDIDRESGIMIVSSKIRVDNDDREYERTAFVYKI
ncbi:Hypothetical predicted protein [Mytilus galloprovincialis]|uniref:B box-type domain-containing protein n=1 Tax=Mytilus galloprovincialis TaxID=29158 RepID=A0A8B6ET36_MYTGA|nr:Hypothetical predicted protein [Mytilus galloprovincialis]